MANPGNTAFGLGAYFQNADQGDFKSLYDKFTQQMGARPMFYDGYVDFGVDPSQWAGNAGWEAGVFAGTGSSYLGPGGGTVPVIGVPLASNAGGWGNVDNFYKQIINGQYDGDYKGVVDSWAGAGYKTVQFRIAYEFNGNWMPWAPGNSGGSNGDFIKAWQHVADLIHQEGAKDGIAAQTVWNPSTGLSWDSVNGQSAEQLYPGDQYVDIISSDDYSNTWPGNLTTWSAGDASGKATGTAPDQTTWAANATNRVHYFNFPGGTASDPTGANSGQLSLQNLIDFAVKHNKPFSLSETGAGNDKSGPQGPQDDPAFPQWEAGVLAKAVNTQGLKVINANLWSYDYNGGDNFIGGERPQEAAAWAKYFGANSATTDGITGGSTGGTDKLNGTLDVASATAGQAIPATTAIATFADTNMTDAASAFKATIAWGDGTTSAGTVTGSNGVFIIDGGHTYAAQGSDKATVTLTRTADNLSATATGPITVAAGGSGGGSGVLAATASLTSATAGQALPATTQVATFTDTSTTDAASAFTATINWGDGQTSAGTISGSNGTFMVDGGHTYAAAGSDALSVTVTPANTAEKAVTANGTVVVAKAGGSGGGTLSGTFDLTTATAGTALSKADVASFTDTSTSDAATGFTAAINWGDGTTSAGTVSGSNGKFMVAGDHTYATAGSDKASVTLTRTADHVVDTVNGTVTVGSGGGGGGTTITIPPTEAMTNITQSNVSVNAASGDHIVFLGGTGDTVSLLGGNQNVYESQGGNTIALAGGTNSMVLIVGSGSNFVEGNAHNVVDDIGKGNTITFMPAIGGGALPRVGIYGNVLGNGDTLDLRQVMATTDWDKNAADINKYLSVHENTVNNVLDLKLSATAGGTSSVIAAFHDYGASTTLNDILAHATVS